MLRSAVLPDGSYDAFIVDVVIGDGTATLDLTILTGDHKGEVVTVSAQGLTGDESDLLGMPATLTVENGEPRVSVDD